MPGYYLLILAAVLLLVVPRKYAPTVFLVAAIFIPMGNTFAFGNLNFFPVRILVVAGLVRIALKREGPIGFPIRTDYYCLAFGVVYVIASLGHKDVQATFIYASAIMLDALGTYFLFRSWIRDWDDVLRFMRLMLLLLIPLMFFMVIEFITHRNLFSYLGGISIESAMREGSVRARGPFRHSILAGTYGALALAFAVALWRNAVLPKLALACSLVIVFVSNSGGPIMTLAYVFIALMLWRYRAHLRTIIRSCLVVLLILHFFVMKVPVWYLMAKIDVGGGGWYRARLIDKAIEHFGNWWLAGTDYTRDWAATGISWSPDAADITNQYLGYGVAGGIVSMLLFIGILACCFKQLSAALKHLAGFPQLQFVVWCLGCVLFGHVVSMLSVSYYDQSVALLYSLIAVIASGCHSITSADLSLSHNEEYELAGSAIHSAYESTAIRA